MRDSEHEPVEVSKGVGAHHPQAVFRVHLIRLHEWIVEQDLHSGLLELAYDLRHAGVTQIGHVRLEGDAEHTDARPLEAAIPRDEELDRLRRDKLRHAVVGPAAGEDHLGMEADRLGLCRQVVRIDADAVPTHQPRAVRVEVPLRACDLQHVARVDPQAIEEHRQLVHERDVEVALDVLDDLRGLGNSNRGRKVQPGLDDRAVDLLDHLAGRFILGGHDLLGALEGVLRVPGVDALG